MATGLKLEWVQVTSTWIPSRPFPVRLRLTSSLKIPIELQWLEGPNPALGFAIFKEGEVPQWHDGAEASALAGFKGGQGEVENRVLAPGGSWETQEDLNQYWLSPMPGRYRLAARYISPSGVIEAPIREIEVFPARLAATHDVLQQSSEPLLAQAWGDDRELWLRLASGRYPLAPRWILPVGKWTGKGVLRVAQHAFSPVADPPIPAYRFWVVWVHQGRLAGTLMDYQGTKVAQFDEALPSLKDVELLTPVQLEKGELFVPISRRERESTVLEWYRISDTGGKSTKWGKWTLPPDAQSLRTAASPRGKIAILWMDIRKQIVFGAMDSIQPKLPPHQELLHLDHGTIVHSVIVDLRDQIDFLAIRLVEEKNYRFVTVHRRGGAETVDTGPIPIPQQIVPKDFRAIWVSRFGAVLVMRDNANYLWIASGTTGAQWKPVSGLRASVDFGATGSMDAVVVWLADSELGLRFLLPSIF